MPLTIYKRGAVWHYRGTVAGRRLRGSTRTESKEIAQRLAANLEAKHWKGHFDGPAAVLTFAQAATLYRNAGKPDRFLHAIEDHWKNTPVRDMTVGAIRQSALVLCPTAGPATRNRHVIVPTQAVINHAATHELCSHIRVKRFPVTKTEKPPATWEWVQAFMAAAVKPNLAALTCLMFLTGARISEALAIEWADVDFRKRRVLIRQTKIGSERWAHMPPALIAVLARIPGERDGQVFRFKSRSNIKTQWEGAIRRAGIVRLTPHSCRHGFATGLLDKGVNPKTVAQRGGWKSVQHVFATYGHDIADADVTDILADTPETQEAKLARVVR